MAAAGDTSANAFWSSVALQMQLMTLSLRSDILKFQTATESLCRLQKVIRTHNKMLRAENEVLQNRIDRLRGHAGHHALHPRPTLSSMQPPEMPAASMWEDVMSNYGMMQQDIARQGIARQDAALAELLGGTPPPQQPPPVSAAGTAVAGWGASTPEGLRASNPCPAGATATEFMSDFAGEVLTCITDLCRAQVGNSVWQQQEHLLMSLINNMPSPEMQQGSGPPEDSLPLPRFGGMNIANYMW
eukprot:CAMPEP_0179090548 /NCGR_PEP_ID=MMETSP0796-20121207/41316_1 /TAXON_ID=73915 /ORGANISM="Pyrodinium bahamense, Strain pbaha01" /LENGTH=243 /DNA_ID=CAMNT_0020788121 /DNA_START=110 /DNA_END=838 /DNA_ORIENTATION=+